ncbi:D-alanyl-D-alanine carboxypeptidase/D-alanyl-D-alanine endopeptidase [Pinibacter aurantiacus]|uniref:D-alanyl-D-alanine carboxypeptidase/D-alanyl-D-alanine-endopeptidase n=1 Tax=Pinibacter aurantiacus TaxID=2851599 RepID=A0A9E2SFU9_9BACT|nr:D-alanyl-D-alanine carboxypeptidase/D-alanyl-D-alanine-endopeptidase [Pinibacter aurantiacus]MBV4360470.1 D-alanyl-D-alanine carboxypeptidase/D-alanyl-D-alanine-endopeptidase [Pinibacter aurantiacus]
MRKVYLSIICMLVCSLVNAQSVKEKLINATNRLEKDTQMKHAVYSLLVIDEKTGNVVFDKNSQVGLATASCLKVVTSATAFELLGKDYRYKTDFAYSKNGDSVNIFIVPHGDPSFGSWRYASTKEEVIYKNITAAFAKANINSNKVSSISIVNKDFSRRFFPEGWIWQDVANYYGAGQGALNWRENQFDVLFNTGKQNANPQVSKLLPAYADININIEELKTGAKNSGDNTYAYFDPTNNQQILVTGSVPAEEKDFSISTTYADPVKYFSNFLQFYSNKNAGNNLSKPFANIHPANSLPADNTVFYTYYSPSLDSLVYWFLKKSINLYGEALMKTLAFEKKGFGATDEGVNILQDFWQQKGIDKTSLNIMDGSGLSPQNRVTTDALVKVLRYAKQQPWFSSYYNSFPEYNGMKLKSGTIGGVKGFCGYHTSKDGNKYIIAFLINGFNGPSASVVAKMYEVLNELK